MVVYEEVAVCVKKLCELANRLRLLGRSDVGRRRSFACCEEAKSVDEEASHAAKKLSRLTKKLRVLRRSFSDWKMFCWLTKKLKG